MDELMEGVGRRLAELTGAEWGIVTSGGAAALCQATAACLTGGDPEKMLRLPDTAHMKSLVVMLEGGRFTYDHAIRGAGAEVVTVGTRPALERALGDRTVMVALLGTGEGSWPVGLEEIVDLAKPRGVPVLIDAASEHLRRPEPYLTRGATMVAYSGGKYLRGPQCTGLLLGEEAWVRAAWLNAAPHHALGRAMKVGKEEVMGALAAVEYWADGRDHVAERAAWRRDLETVADEARATAVEARILDAENGKAPVPRLEVRWDPDRVGITGLELRDRLLDGDPRVMLDDRGATSFSVTILPFSLQPGEAEVVGRRIGEVLGQACEGRSAESPAPARVCGEWAVDIEYVSGGSTHYVSIVQEECRITGVHRTRFLESPLSGCVEGDRIAFSSAHRFEGTHLCYRFSGSVEGEQMGGTVEMGSCGQSAPGPLNQREYGTAHWEARRQQ